MLVLRPQSTSLLTIGDPAVSAAQDLGRLRDNSGAIIDNATAIATLYTRNGDEVAGQVWPITLTSESEGLYVGTISADANVENGALYSVKVVATLGSIQRTWVEDTVARWGDRY